LLGVNLGGLGFMTAVSPERLDTQLSQLLLGTCRVEERRMIRAEVWRRGRRKVVADALNDVSVARAGVGRLIQLEASVDGRFLASFRVDGLVFSTPTGSTAYSLSLGGPVLDPTAPAFLLTLIAPHTLSSRPLALHDSRIVELRVPTAGMELSADGKRPLRLYADDRIRLARAPFNARLVFPPSHDPWAVLRNKLGWQGHGLRGGHRA
jgi:NAD+ kinase